MDLQLESVVANQAMVDDFDDAAVSDAEVAAVGDALLADTTVVDAEGCWWNTFVYPCSNVAASLTRIKMRSQSLVRFPRSVVFGVANVSHLSLLDLRDNNVTSLPPWLRELTGLHELLLSNNRIRSVDPALYELRSLRVRDRGVVYVLFVHARVTQRPTTAVAVVGEQ